MNYKKIANAKHEDIGAYTTRSTTRHGMSRVLRREKRRRNRTAKRVETRIHFSDQRSGCDLEYYQDGVFDEVLLDE